MERILVQDHDDGKGYSATLFENDQQLIDAAIERLGFSYREYTSEDLEFIDNEDLEGLLKCNSTVIEVATQDKWSDYYTKGKCSADFNLTVNSSGHSFRHCVRNELPTKTEAAIFELEDSEDGYGLFTISEAVQFIKDHHADMHIDTYKALTKILKPRLKYRFISEKTIIIEDHGHDTPTVWLARDHNHIIDTAVKSAGLVFRAYLKEDVNDETCPLFAEMLEKHDCIIEAGTQTESSYYSLDSAPCRLEAALYAIESHTIKLYTLTMTEARQLVDGDKSQYTGRHQIEVTKAIKDLIDV